MKQTKKIIFFGLIGVLVLAIPVLAYGIFNTMVGLKYETKSPKDCISLITGQDLCLRKQLLIGLTSASILIVVLLAIIRKRFLQ